MFESVDLPAPFSPSSACTSPSAASNSTPSFATTPGNRFVIPRSATATGMGENRVGRTAVLPTREGSALRAPDDALDEPVHRIELVHRHPVTLLDAQLALLVVQRACEFVERAVDELCSLCGDLRLRRRRHARAVRGEPDHPVLDVAVVEARLPGAVHGGLDTLRVVRAPVVDGRGQP